MPRDPRRTGGPPPPLDPRGHGAQTPYEGDDVAFGQLPEDAPKLEFKTLQTYDSGKVVRWIEEAGQGDDDPE
ncbi:DUF1775 domain-containing protein, partial [Streptomyces acidiscabies]|uniref:DUF1775 domain-containing protein n=1 Tax=Streptomyces acidiscabies TaxID=42234 RepID=UPI001F3D819D